MCYIRAFQGFQSFDGMLDQCLGAFLRARGLPGPEIAEDNLVGIGGRPRCQSFLRIQDLVQISRLTAGHALSRCRGQKMGVLFQRVERLLLLRLRKCRIGDDLVGSLEIGAGLFDLVLAGFIHVHDLSPPYG